MKKMKLGWFFLAVIFMAGVTSAKPDLILIDENGVSNEWKIVSYNPPDDVVKLRGGSGAVEKPIDELEAVAQQKVKGWLERKVFDSSKLQVRLKQNSTAREIDIYKHGRNYEGEISSLVNEIVVENNSSVQFRNIRVRARVFVDRQQDERGDKLSVEQMFVFDLGSGETQSFKMDAIELRSLLLKDPYSDEETSGAPTIYVKDQLAGVLCVISGESSADEPLGKEFELKKSPRKPEEYKVADEALVYHEETPRTPKGKDVSFRMVEVPGGSFVMGKGREVTLDSFEISNIEVSRNQIDLAFGWAVKNEKKIKVNESDSPAGFKPSHLVRYQAKDNDRRNLVLMRSKDSQWYNYYVQEPGRNERVLGVSLPIVTATWYGAIMYCNYRSEMEGLPLCYTFGKKEWECDFSLPGYRLPTEAEWEFAARGGVHGENTLYSGSDNLDDVGWNAVVKDFESRFQEISYGVLMVTYEQSKPSCRGRKQPNKLGLYDMSGNAREWCFDWFGKYDDRQQVNPAGSGLPRNKKEQVKVHRGGYWKGPEVGCQVTTRSKGHPEDDTAGFRVVRSVLPQQKTVQ